MTSRRLPKSRMARVRTIVINISTILILTSSPAAGVLLPTIMALLLASFPVNHHHSSSNNDTSKILLPPPILDHNAPRACHSPMPMATRDGIPARWHLGVVCPMVRDRCSIAMVECAMDGGAMDWPPEAEEVVEVVVFVPMHLRPRFELRRSQGVRSRHQVAMKALAVAILVTYYSTIIISLLHHHLPGPNSLPMGIR
jgi:hypothetical protein